MGAPFSGGAPHLVIPDIEGEQSKQKTKGILTKTISLGHNVFALNWYFSPSFNAVSIQLYGFPWGRL